MKKNHKFCMNPDYSDLTTSYLQESDHKASYVVDFLVACHRLNAC